MNHKFDLLPEGFYILSNPNAPTDACLVKLYSPPDLKCRCIGFGVWDGAAVMPVTDLLDTSNLTPVEIRADMTLFLATKVS